MTFGKPSIGRQGQSEATQAKESDLAGLLEFRLRTLAQVMRNRDDDPFWLRLYDLYSGCGHNDAYDCPGSPIVMCDAVAKLIADREGERTPGLWGDNRPYTWRAADAQRLIGCGQLQLFFSDASHEQTRALNYVLDEKGYAFDSHIRNSTCDAVTRLREIGLWTSYGREGRRCNDKIQRHAIVFLDPNAVADFEGPAGGLLDALNQCRRPEFIDYIMNFPATSMKRVKNSPLTREHHADWIERFYKTLSRMNDLRKGGHCWIREPIGAHQWTIIVYWAWLPPFNSGWEAHEFYEWNSPAARRIFDKITTSARERA